jgi:hypothetical protein
MCITKKSASSVKFLRYLVGKKIANGAFGQLRLGKDLSTEGEVAIKMELAAAKIPMLYLEFRFYNMLKGEVSDTLSRQVLFVTQG